jgi:hypothetical protein
MQDYQPNVHYDTHGLTFEQRVALLRAAKEDAAHWWVDKLGGADAAVRRQVDMTFEDIMAKFEPNSHFVFIYRRGYTERRRDPTSAWHWYLEVGFCTMGRGVDHYLWLQLPEELVEPYANKYDLKEY